MTERDKREQGQEAAAGPRIVKARELGLQHLGHRLAIDSTRGARVDDVAIELVASWVKPSTRIVAVRFENVRPDVDDVRTIEPLYAFFSVSPDADVWVMD